MPAPAVGGGSLGRGARARILAAAEALFARQGINATSVNELRAAARVSKRTLYRQFASKDELVLAHLAASDQRRADASVLARAKLAPRARLLELFTALAEPGRPATPDPVLAALIEFPDPEHPIHRAAAEHRRRFSERLAALARAAGARDPDAVGQRLTLLYDGAACRALAVGTAAAAADSYALAAAVLRDAIDG